MTTVTGHDIDGFREAFGGRVITAADDDFDTARKVWNGEIDRRPALIARCSSAADVREAIGFGRDAGLEIAVRGGGHNFGGAAVCDDGLVVDLSPIRAVSVDPAARTARCGGGATLADLDAATQEHALAVPGGTISHTGVGGLTLGGGFGWLTNRHGLTCDNLRSAEVVTADGEVRRAAPRTGPDARRPRRGGGGNFGVVTEFEFALHPVGPIVQVALLFWDLEQGQEALRLCREVTENLPTDLGSLIAGVNAPPAPFVPERYHGQPGYALILAGFGAAEQHAAVVDQVRAGVPPLFDFVSPIPYTQLQQLLDASAPWGVCGYEKAVSLESLSDEVIDVVTERMPVKNSPMSIVPAFPLGGAFRAVDDDATAFGVSRQAGMIFNIGAVSPDDQLMAAERAWVRGFHEALLPHAMSLGSYVNFINDFEAEPDRVRASYPPAKYERLARIKARYDPDNVFHLNPNIKPAV
jgi:FAD/FMN-containing dehydrogenase